MIHWILLYYCIWGSCVFERAEFNSAFILGAGQQSKLRERDDRIRNAANLRKTTPTPVTLSTRGHISQVFKHLYAPNRGRSFLNCDHDSSYKKLPLDPEFAFITAVSLRDPFPIRWMAFIPSYGSAGDLIRTALHLLCAGSLISFGVAVFNYFGDFGAPIPDPLATRALYVIEDVCDILRSLMKRGDTWRGNRYLSYAY